MNRLIEFPQYFNHYEFPIILLFSKLYKIISIYVKYGSGLLGPQLYLFAKNKKEQNIFIRGCPIHVL